MTSRMLYWQSMQCRVDTQISLEKVEISVYTQLGASFFLICACSPRFDGFIPVKLKVLALKWGAETHTLCLTKMVNLQCFCLDGVCMDL